MEGKNDSRLEKYLSTHPRGEVRIKSATEETHEFRKKTLESAWEEKRNENVYKVSDLFKIVKHERKLKKQKKPVNQKNGQRPRVQPHK